MTKANVMSGAETKRRSRANKPKEYHEREREMSRQRMKIRRAKEKAQNEARQLKTRLSEGDREEIEALSSHARQCLLQDWFLSRDLEYYPGILSEGKKLFRPMTKMELNNIEAKVANFEISVIEERVDNCGSSDKLLNRLEFEGGGGRPTKESTVIDSNSTNFTSQLFCGLCDDKYRGPSDCEIGHTLKEDKTAPATDAQEALAAATDDGRCHLEDHKECRDVNGRESVAAENVDVRFGVDDAHMFCVECRDDGRSRLDDKGLNFGAECFAERHKNMDRLGFGMDIGLGLGAEHFDDGSVQMDEEGLHAKNDFELGNECFFADLYPWT